MQTIRLGGSIDTTPVAMDRGAAVVAARKGGLVALDRTEAGNKLSFQSVASRPVSSAGKVAHYLIVRAEWRHGRRHVLGRRPAADDALRSPRRHPGESEQRIVPQATSDVGMKFVQGPAD